MPWWWMETCLLRVEAPAVRRQTVEFCIRCRPRAANLSLMPLTKHVAVGRGPMSGVAAGSVDLRAADSVAARQACFDAQEVVSVRAFAAARGWMPLAANGGARHERSECLNLY